MVLKLKQVAMGDNYTMFLMEDGTVKGVGYNYFGQLGLGNIVTPRSTIQNIPITGVKQISCGDGHTMFLMEDGTVKGVGYNYFGQLGLGNIVTPQSITQTIPITGVKQIACGGAHTMFLMEDGTVKGVGLNTVGQLGLGNINNQSTIQTTLITGVKQIECGSYHTMFLMEDGTVQGVGENLYGELGSTNNSLKISKPILANVIKVKQISCGSIHTMFLMEDGTVKGAGYNAKGQLGLGHIINSQPIQTIPITGVKQISSGTHHTMFLMEDGTVKGVGYNVSGQLGLGNNIDISTIQTIPIIRVKQIIAKTSSTIFIMVNSTVKVSGQNNQGQLGLNNVVSPQLNILLTSIVMGIDFHLQYSNLLKEQNTFKIDPIITETTETLINKLEVLDTNNNILLQKDLNIEVIPHTLELNIPNTLLQKPINKLYIAISSNNVTETIPLYLYKEENSILAIDGYIELNSIVKSSPEYKSFLLDVKSEGNYLVAMQKLDGTLKLINKNEFIDLEATQENVDLTILGDSTTKIKAFGLGWK